MIYLVSNQLNAFGGEFKQISLLEAVTLLNTLSILGLDTETQGLDPYTKKLLTIQIGNKDFQIVFDIESYGYVIPNILREFLCSKDKIFILQNAKFDLKFFYYQGIIIGNVYDTMLAEIILTNGLQYDGRDLSSLCQKYCGTSLDKSIRNDIITKGLSNAVIKYAACDVIYLEDIRKKQLSQAKFLKVTEAIKLDNAFVKVLAYIEFCGIKLDWEKWRIKSQSELEQLGLDKKELEKWLLSQNLMKYFNGMQDMFSNEQSCILNWNSPKQLVPFFESLGVNCTVYEKGIPKKSVTEDVLIQQLDKSEVIPIYLKYKKQKKSCSTYGLNWIKYINPVTKRIHTTFTQLKDTGRLSCGNKFDDTPNLQNLPAKENTRSCFIAEKGNKYIAVDYSSQESIVLANFSRDENLLEFYRKGFEDIHSYVTFLLFPEVRRMSLKDLTNDELVYIKKNFKEKRNIAKTAESID